MVVLRLANFYIASIRETLRAVNVMTARDLARIQKDGGRGGPRFVYIFKNNAYHWICIMKYKNNTKNINGWLRIKIKYDVNVPYLPVYNAHPYIMRTLFFKTLSRKKL